MLIVGCGDVGLRVARLLAGRCNLRALSSQESRRAELRQAGITPLIGNLDAQPGRRAASSAQRRGGLHRLAGLASWLVHLAPPPTQGGSDPRTRHLLAALAPGLQAPRALVYASTTGVYGDAAGAWIDETRPVAPATPRAQRRVDAEQALRRWSVGRIGVPGGSTCVSILRVPGIYALDRPGGDPRERVRRGAPILRAEDDVYTNHIQADDLARACVAALWRGRPQRVVHASDDSTLRMGDYFELVADLHGLPRPPRRSRAEVEAALGPMAASFLRESRRLNNGRLHAELRLPLRYPTVHEGLRAVPGDD